MNSSKLGLMVTLMLFTLMTTMVSQFSSAVTNDER